MTNAADWKVISESEHKELLRKCQQLQTKVLELQDDKAILRQALHTYVVVPGIVSHVAAYDNAVDALAAVAP